MLNSKTFSLNYFHFSNFLANFFHSFQLFGLKIYKQMNSSISIFRGFDYSIIPEQLFPELLLSAALLFLVTTFTCSLVL